MNGRELAERLHSAAIRLLRHVRPEDVAAGLTAARLSALSVLVFGGERTVTELATAEQVAVPTMTRLLQGMERDRLVVRRRDRSDARIVQVRATPAGRRALEEARDRRVRSLERLLGGVQPAERRTLAAAVSVLEEVLGARAGEAGLRARRGERRRDG